MPSLLPDVLCSLACPVRLALFERIARDGEVTAGTLVTSAAVSQPAVSQHLRALRLAGLVQERRAGRRVLYRAAPEGLAPLVEWLARHAGPWRERFDATGTLLPDAKTAPEPRAIVVERRLAHPPDLVWRSLTDHRLITRWLMANDFAPILGHRFTLQTKPVGDWDSVVRCEVLAIEPPRLLRYSWRGGSDSNPRHGARPDTTVTWTLAPDAGGTLLCMVHDGFASPGNDFAHDVMQRGWIRAVETMARLADG